MNDYGCCIAICKPFVSSPFLLPNINLQINSSMLEGDVRGVENLTCFCQSMAVLQIKIWILIILIFASYLDSGNKPHCFNLYLLDGDGILFIVAILDSAEPSLWVSFFHKPIIFYIITQCVCMCVCIYIYILSPVTFLAVNICLVSMYVYMHHH